MVTTTFFLVTEVTRTLKLPEVWSSLRGTVSCCPAILRLTFWPLTETSSASTPRMLALALTPRSNVIVQVLPLQEALSLLQPAARARVRAAIGTTANRRVLGEV